MMRNSRINRLYDGDIELYTIAEIGSNFNGSIDEAFNLIKLSADSGADAVKFQHYTAQTLVSDNGFKLCGNNLAHQKKWSKSVFEVYDKVKLEVEWTERLMDCAHGVDLDFITSPYSIELLNKTYEYLDAIKIGSGDIDYLDLIAKAALKPKPIIIATGASHIQEVIQAYNTASQSNTRTSILQCNTNYENVDKNYDHINLNVLKTYRERFPNAILGISDHTVGDTTALGAIALGGRIIEKHFTNDRSGNGPDQSFSTLPNEWRNMVNNCKIMLRSLGQQAKTIEANEYQTATVQRRSLFSTRVIRENEVIDNSNTRWLRPKLKNGITPDKQNLVFGKEVNKDIAADQSIKWSDLK